MHLELEWAVSFLPFIGVYAATSGDTYQIAIEKINSNGSYDNTFSTLGVSTTAIADGNGKIEFILSSIPDNTQCNFLVVKVEHESITADSKLSVVPCPNAGEQLPLGVSDLTDMQANALLYGFLRSSTDDAGLAVFVYTGLRTMTISANDVETLIDDVLIPALMTDANGFYNHLKTARGLTDIQLNNYRKAIVHQLADTSSNGYSRLIKESVDDATGADIDSVSALEKRGKAAARLLNVLIEAAIEVDINQDYIFEAFQALSDIGSAATNSSSLSPEIKSSVSSSIGNGLGKLAVDRKLAQYAKSIEHLGATSNEVTQFRNASETLVNSLLTIFSNFEKEALKKDIDKATIDTKSSVLTTDIETAMGDFITNVAASLTRVAQMATNLNTALGLPTNTITASMFSMKKMNGTAIGLPIPVVILFDYIATVQNKGGSLTYTRDDVSFNEFSGSCADTSLKTKTTCEAGSQAWTIIPVTFFSSLGSIGTLFAITSEVASVSFAYYNDQQAGNDDLEDKKRYISRLKTIEDSISGTIDGDGTPVSNNIKRSIVKLLETPDLNL